MSIEKHSDGSLSEMDMRILIGEVGYEIVLNSRGYAIEDKLKGGRMDGITFDTIAEIYTALEDEIKIKFGKFEKIELSDEEKHAKKIKNLVSELSVLDDADIVSVATELLETIDAIPFPVIFVNIGDDSPLLDELDGQKGREKLIETSIALEILEGSGDELEETIRRYSDIGIYNIVIGS